MGESAELDVTGDVGSMDGDHRLVIPSRVRDSLAWFPRKGSGPFALVADLRDTGLVRLYPADLARSRLDVVRKQLAVHPEPLRALAAFADRYRDLSYYASDTRVHCGAAVGWHLRGASKQPNSFYVEALGEFIDVMTLERRDTRLQELKTALDLPGE